MNAKFLVFVILTLFLVSLMGQAFAADENADTNKQTFLSRQAVRARMAIQTAESNMQKMQKAGLATTRVQDTLEIAVQLFEAEKTKEAAGETADYALATQKAKEAAGYSEQAFNVSDELSVLKEYVTGLADIDNVEIYKILATAEQEIRDERYEKAKEKIDEAYLKIDEVQSFAFRTTAMYAAATSNIINFILAFKIQLSLIFGIPFALWIFFRNKIRAYFIKKRITRLEIQKNVLSDMVKNTQKEYFIDASISEGIYNIRVNVFGRMVRDITRKIAILLEEEKKSETRIFSKINGFFKIKKEALLVQTKKPIWKYEEKK